MILAADAAQAETGAHNGPSVHLIDFDLVGKPYSRVRSTLMARGNIPIDVRKQQSQGGTLLCEFDDKFCGYQELDACAADIYVCVLEWKERSGRSFQVQVDVTPPGPGLKQRPDPRVDAIWEEP